MFVKTELPKAVLGAVAIVLATTSIAAQAEQDSVDKLSERLIELRGEVEDLNAELTMLRDEHKQHMASLVTQRGELAAQLNREQLNRNKLKQTLAQNRALAAQAGTDAAQLIPVVQQSLSELERYVESGLPFKIKERLADLREIRQQLNAGVLSPAKAVNRLWAFCEDEIHLTEENGIYRQTIELNNATMLADVAKLGMVMMYFKTPDEQYGRVTRTSSGWRYELLQASGDAKQVAYLFESLRKQIRSGYFVLPNAI